MGSLALLQSLKESVLGQAELPLRTNKPPAPDPWRSTGTAAHPLTISNAKVFR